jgi:hypothetical protein
VISLKKSLLLFVALAFALSLVAGCGGDPTPPAGEAAKTSRLPDPQPQDNSIPATAAKSQNQDDASIIGTKYSIKDLDSVDISLNL